MLEGRWRAFRTDGTYIGIVGTGMGNDTILIPNHLRKEFIVNDVVHIDETHSQKAWIVQITGVYLNQDGRFWIKKIAERDHQYPKPEIKPEPKPFSWEIYVKAIEIVFGLQGYPKAARFWAWVFPIMAILGLLIIFTS